MTTYLTPQEFARTYSHPSYDDPWNAVLDYQRVQEYAAAHPEAGRTRVGNALDLPASRVRGWLKSIKPDCVHGIQTANRNDWLNVAVDSSVFRGLSGLVAWIFSGGSITTDTYAPLFVPATDAHHRHLTQLATDANIQLERSRPEPATKTQEYRPTRHASVLGRCLSLLGAPVGEKTPETPITIPEYLTADTTPLGIKREWLSIYLGNRAQLTTDSSILRFRESRPNAYLTAFAAFAESVVGEPVRITENNVVFTVPATREIQSWPEWPPHHEAPNNPTHHQ